LRGEAIIDQQFAVIQRLKDLRASTVKAEYSAGNPGYSLKGFEHLAALFKTHAD
jgi:hypothetical protein